jgi:hypothetical protein
MGSYDRFLHSTFIEAMTLGQLHAGSRGIDRVDSIDPMTLGQLHDGSRGIDKVDRTEPKKARLLYPYRADGWL